MRADDKYICRACRSTIVTMAFKGTGYCCERCRKVDAAGT